MPKTREELLEEFEAAEQGIRLWTAQRAEVGKLLGKVGSTDIGGKLSAEEEAVSLWDKLTSAEITELYQTDREAWQEMIDQLQSAGERKLDRSNR